MKTKLVIIFLSFSTLSANPIIVAVGKEIIKKAPKIIPKVVPLLATITELNAQEVKKPMSKKKLDLYKTKF